MSTHVSTGAQVHLSRRSTACINPCVRGVLAVHGDATCCVGYD
jgi:hypothetical protein